MNNNELGYAWSQIAELQEKLDSIQEFLNYEKEHCTDTVDENAPGCRKAPDIYKLGIYNSTNYIKVIIEQFITKGYKFDSETGRIKK